MLLFQQERHVIERGAQWRTIRTSRTQFDSITGRQRWFLPWPSGFQRTRPALI
jgi:hypothetical protein